jgi:orotidine-5'-phosphate decarboxylase
VRAISRLGHGIFLDLKYHDIPNTVAGAVTAAAGLPGVRLLNIHTLGGVAMMEAAAEALRRATPRGKERPKLLGVTILTSMDAKTMRTVGMSGKPLASAVQLARLAKKCGLDGVVTSTHEAAHIRRACGPGFIIVVGGVRPAERRRKYDQARVATPAEAIRAGADYLVVGRPITGARDPLAAANAILEEMRLALRSRV